MDIFLYMWTRVTQKQIVSAADQRFVLPRTPPLTQHVHAGSCPHAQREVGCRAARPVYSNIMRRCAPDRITTTPSPAMCSPELPALVRVFAKTLNQSKQPAALNRAAHAGWFCFWLYGTI